MNTASSTQAVSTARSSNWSARVALAFGILIVFGAGFASPMVLHNAAHDTRHAFGLPCH